VSEAELIEIAQRRRKLEDAIGRADDYLKSNEADYRAAIKKADADYEKHKNFARFCREGNEPEADLLGVVEARAALEKWSEACRDDMNRMADWIRGRVGK
jgi:hypothetical protein